MQPQCCFIGCNKPAEFVLIEGAAPDDYTEACADHVEALKSDRHVETVRLQPATATH
jgi:hypothetical protein